MTWLCQRENTEVLETNAPPKNDANQSRFCRQVVFLELQINLTLASDPATFGNVARTLFYMCVCLEWPVLCSNSNPTGLGSVTGWFYCLQQQQQSQSSTLIRASPGLQTLNKTHWPCLVSFFLFFLKQCMCISFAFLSLTTERAHPNSRGGGGEKSFFPQLEPFHQLSCSFEIISHGLHLPAEKPWKCCLFEK